MGKLVKNRLSLYLDNEVHEYVKRESDAYGVSMSAFINIAIKRYKDEQEVLKGMPKMLEFMEQFKQLKLADIEK